MKKRTDKQIKTHKMVCFTKADILCYSTDDRKSTTFIVDFGKIIYMKRRKVSSTDCKDACLSLSQRLTELCTFVVFIFLFTDSGKSGYASIISTDCVESFLLFCEPI